MYEGKLRVRPAVLYRKLMLKPGERYSNTKQMETQTALSRLGIFKYAEMQYKPQATDSSRCNNLDLRINTAYDLPLDGELEFNVTTKSNDQTGPGAIFSVTKKNVFGGGESWGVQLKGSYEWQTGNRVDGASSLMNSYEMGLSSTLTLPQLFFPGISEPESEIPLKYDIPHLCRPAESGQVLQDALFWRKRHVRLPEFGHQSSFRDAL